MCYSAGGKQIHAEAVAFGVSSAPRGYSVASRATMWEEEIGPHRG